MSFHFLVQMTDQLDGTPILVDMFFVLSGFLITTLLFEERAKRGAISLRDFYLRRIFRLFPAVYALLAVFTLFALVVGGEHRAQLLAEALTAALYVYNLFVAWTGVEGQVLIQLWTLSLEEQFYFVWPLLLIGALKLGRQRRFPVLIGAMLAVVVVTAAAAHGPGAGGRARAPSSRSCSAWRSCAPTRWCSAAWRRSCSGSSRRCDSPVAAAVAARSSAPSRWSCTR